MTRASNNYGPYQFPEKLIPLMISNALEDKSLPVYGDGMQVRDWLYVDDHCRAIRAVLEKGVPGEIYNIGARAICPTSRSSRKFSPPRASRELDRVRQGPARPRSPLRDHVRQGDDEIGGRPPWTSRKAGATVASYRANPGWVERVRSGEYHEYYERNYGARV